MSKCLVVTCLPCEHPFPQLESLFGCRECGMLEWLCFKTEEEQILNLKKQNPKRFDENGNYIKII